MLACHALPFQRYMLADTLMRYAMLRCRSPAAADAAALRAPHSLRWRYAMP